MRSLIVPCLISVGCFLFAYLMSYCAIGPGPFDMDPGREPKAFEEHLKRYQNLFQLIVTLSTATVAFLVNFLIGITPDKTQNVYSQRLELACTFTILTLGASVILALLFIIFENLAYEAYSEYLQTHRTNPTRKNPYTRKWYAANLGFGYSSLILFLLAYGFLAFSLLKS